MQEKSRVLKAAGLVSSLTLFSRITGFIRDAIIAAVFGAGLYADAFWAAFRIPNLLRRLLGEGSLNASFIPVYADVREHQGEERTREFFNACFTFLTMILTAVTALGILFAPVIVRFLVPGFSDEAAKQETTILLLRIMFPYSIMVCVVALFMGVLNSRGHFFAPAFSPVLLNLGMISAAALLVNKLDLPVMALTYGVLAGGVMQVALQIPFLRKFRHLPRLRFALRDPDMRRVAVLMLPALIGLSVQSINVFLSTTIASLLIPGAVSFLTYADRLMEFPQGGFAIAIETAIFPSLAALAAKKDHDGLIELMKYGFRMVLFIMIPTTVGLFVLAQPIVNVLFQRGKFDFHATVNTAMALRYYTLGLVFFGTNRILVPTFYAMKNTMTPALIAMGALVVNLGCGLMFTGPTTSDSVHWISVITRSFNPTGPMQHAGLALGNSIAALFNFTVLAVLLRKKLGRLGARRILKTAVTCGFAALVMAAAVYFIARPFTFESSGFGLVKTLGLTLSISAGAVIYLVIMAFFERQLLIELLGRLARRKIVAENRKTTPAG